MSIFQRWEEGNLAFMGGKITFIPPNSWAEVTDGTYDDYQMRKAALVSSGWIIVDDNDSPPDPFNPKLKGFGDTKLKRKSKK